MATRAGRYSSPVRAKSRIPSSPVQASQRPSADRANGPVQEAPRESVLSPEPSIPMSYSMWYLLPCVFMENKTRPSLLLFGKYAANAVTSCALCFNNNSGTPGMATSPATCGSASQLELELGAG